MTDGDAEQLRREGASLPPELVDPHPGRLPAGEVDHLIAAHRAAVEDGDDGYVDPDTGLFCFTAHHHWRKGQCCALGCRHCPWVDAAGRLGHR